MAGEGVHLTGGDEVLRRHREILEKAGAEVKRMLDKAALDTESRAKDICPVDTGRLRSSIAISSPTEFTRDVGPRGVEYAVDVEMGTNRSRAQPYMRPAYELIRPGLEAALEQLAQRVSGR